MSDTSLGAVARPSSPTRTKSEHLVKADAGRAAVIAHLVALAHGISVAEILHGGSRPGATRARQVCIYLANVGLGWTLTRAGAAFGRDRTTAGQACRAVEELRDDPVLDRKLDDLERLVTSDLFQEGVLA
jgi:chromosomal replication initiation ATPase DnaA